MSGKFFKSSLFFRAAESEEQTLLRRNKQRIRQELLRNRETAEEKTIRQQLDAARKRNRSRKPTRTFSITKVSSPSTKQNQNNYCFTRKPVKFSMDDLENFSDDDKSYEPLVSTKQISPRLQPKRICNEKILMTLSQQNSNFESSDAWDENIGVRIKVGISRKAGLC